MKLSVCERFLSFQGEGDKAGRLAYFIRVTGCNLNCRWCDSKHAMKGGTRIEIDDLVAAVRKYPAHTRVVVTGGEPMLYQEALVDLAQQLQLCQMDIETNGTIMPDPHLLHVIGGFNVSPKLSSSGNGTKGINLNVLDAFIDEGTIFKFVVKTRRDFDEVGEIIKELDVDLNDIWIMPEGVTHAAWRKNALKIIPWVLDAGYNLSPRLHVAIWDNKKGV